MGDLLDKFLNLAQQAGPFAAVIMTFLWWRSEAERRAISEKFDSERETLTGKYDALVAKFVSLAGDTQATLKDWRDLLIKTTPEK